MEVALRVTWLPVTNSYHLGLNRVSHAQLAERAGQDS